MTPISWDEQTDVVIIGSGLAGLAAGIEARQAGVSALVLEKMKVTGGNSRIADGGLAAAGSFLQRRLGVEDSPDQLAADMLKAGLGLNHPQLVRIVATRAAEIIDWLHDDLGVRYRDRLDRSGGHSVARSITTSSHSGVEIIKAQVQRFKVLGGEIRTRCFLEELITDQNGDVTGVRIRSGYQYPDADSGETQHIRARRGVVLATGGFGNDVAFRCLQNPRLDASISSTNHRGATAEGMVAALKIHAAPVHLSWIQTGPWACADELGYGKGCRLASYCVYPFGILVDPATGLRIVNEWSDRRQRAEAIIKTGHPCIGIVDAPGAQADTESLTHCLKTGKARQFETLAALAADYDIPVEPLQQTVETYNRMVSAGQTDDFGKSLSADARALSQPPFYAMRLWPKVHYTPGGLAIDTQARVRDLDNRPIGRLFAAGEVCGGIHGASRLGGCALPECLIFGRIAGQQAAAQPSR